MKQPSVYIMASGWDSTLYVGVTPNLIKRVHEHKCNITDGFTKKYNVDQLVWHEQHTTMTSAITREKAIKAWKRQWKIREITQMNPTWQDLYETLL